MALEEQRCACKGIRRCLLCDADRVTNPSAPHSGKSFVYCPRCGDKAWLEEQFDSHIERVHRNDVNNFEDDECINIDGVFMQENVITIDEELKLIDSIDSFDWVDSQSGRRKQDFGPKINFKKRKLNLDPFRGLPLVDMQLFDSIKSRLKPHKHSQRFSFKDCGSHFTDDTNCDNILKNFHSVEVCHLEYCPSRGSSIDPHFDDFWIWGERLVTLNLQSSTVITLNEPNENSGTTSISICTPPRSILVLYGDARYKYHHSIKPMHITQRRLAVTFRELPRRFLHKSSPEYVKYALGFIERAQQRLG